LVENRVLGVYGALSVFFNFLPSSQSSSTILIMCPEAYLYVNELYFAKTYRTGFKQKL